MPKTLDEGFAAFLKKLEPLESERTKAKSHNASVKSCLERNFECYRFFETGSFGTSTGVRHYSDTDYFAVCRTEGLKGNSSTELRQVKEALEVTFPRTTGIGVSTPAVRLPFGTFESETLEVTPCVYTGMAETPVGNHPSYHIADGAGNWMASSPSAHTAYVKQQDERLGGKLKPLIQLVKAWKFYKDVPIRSFYLELRVTKYAEAETSIIYDIDLHRIMRMLNNNGLASMRDPMGISGLIAPCATDAKKTDALSKLNTGATRAEKAYDNRDDADKAFHWWNLFFDERFPAR